MLIWGWFALANDTWTIATWAIATWNITTWSIQSGSTGTSNNVVNTVNTQTGSISSWIVTGNITSSIPIITNTSSFVTPPQIILNLSSVTAGVGIPEDPEFVEALARLYNNKITSFATPGTYRPFDKITREESAKIFARFAKTILKKEPRTDIEDVFCIFIDQNKISKDLAADVFDACKLGLFRGGIDGFYPQVGLTKSQSIVALVRMFDNKTYAENTDPWFLEYYNRAIELGITKDKDLNNFNRFVTRYEIALMIYRFNLKYKLFQQFNGNILNPNELVWMLQESVVTSSDGLKRGTALFNTDILSNPNLESIPFQAFSGDKYIIKKRKVDNYGGGNSNFIWFGDIYTTDEKTFLGTASFTVIRGFIEEAYIRPTELWKKYYIIKPSSQQPYYTIEEIVSE